MSKPNVTKMMHDIRRGVSKHSPEILTGIGIAGMVTTTVLAVKATPKALMLIEDGQYEKGAPLTPAEKVKVAWKPYIPAVVTGVAATTCLIGASSVSAKRNAALVTAYKLSETALTEYRDKVVETIGEKKERKVREEVAQERVKKNPVNTTEIYITEKGNTRFYDVMGHRRFVSDLERVKKIFNDLNYRMRDEMYISLNDFYREVGLDPIPIGDMVGWNIDKGQIEVDYDTTLDDDGTPCIVVDYLARPTYGYDKLY